MQAQILQLCTVCKVSVDTGTRTRDLRPVRYESYIIDGIIPRYSGPLLDSSIVNGHIIIVASTSIQGHIDVRFDPLPTTGL